LCESIITWWLKIRVLQKYGWLWTKKVGFSSCVPVRCDIVQNGSLY
jgi:hypothetical protein